MRKPTVPTVPPVPLNRKMAVKGHGPVCQPRVTHRAAHRKTLPRFRIACGCCPEQIEIYYSDLDQPNHATIEINGVDGGIQDWRNILLPLLGFERRNGGWIDQSETQTPQQKQLKRAKQILEQLRKEHGRYR